MGNDEARIQSLAGQFRAWGVGDPESWARSQVEEGINQYARLVFLRGAWEAVMAAGDQGWIDRQVRAAMAHPDEPGAGAGLALARLLAAGVNPGDLLELVRAAQWETLARVVVQLSDPGVVTYPSTEAPRVAWALFEVDEEGNPLQEIPNLHESVLETDPSGREMRPARDPEAGRPRQP